VNIGAGSPLVLHASQDARPLYEKLGFVPTNEMRYTGDPRPQPDRSDDE